MGGTGAEAEGVDPWQRNRVGEEREWPRAGPADVAQFYQY